MRLARRLQRLQIYPHGAVIDLGNMFVFANFVNMENTHFAAGRPRSPQIPP
jgi:hypothetical protein